MTCVSAKRTAECVHGGLGICPFRTRKILPATTAVPSFAHGNENGSQSSSSSSSETLFIHEDGISRPVNSRSTSFTPSRPRGPTLGLISTNPDLSGYPLHPPKYRSHLARVTLYRPKPQQSQPPRTLSLWAGTLPKNTPTTTVLLCPSSPLSCFRKSPRRLRYRSGSWENHNYKSLIRCQGSWNYHCEFWVSVCETVVGTNIQPQPPRGFCLDEDNGDPPHTSETKSVGGWGHIKCRPTSVLRVQDPVARDAPFRDPQILPSYGLTPREIHPKVLGGTREHPTGE